MSKPRNERHARLFGDVYERDPCALRRKGLHQRCPDAGAAAGDEHARVLEVREMGLHHRHRLVQ